MAAVFAVPVLSAFALVLVSAFAGVAKVKIAERAESGG